MATAEADFVELEDAFQPILQIPLNGKKYRVAAVDYKTGVYFQKILTLGAKAHAGSEISTEDIELVSDEDEPEFMRRALGDTFDELLEDGISYSGMKFASSLVFVWTTQDYKTALELWRSRGKAPEEVPTPNREQRRMATRTRTDVAPSTRKPGSASGTNSQKATAKAKAGRTSSNTGG